MPPRELGLSFREPARGNARIAPMRYFLPCLLALALDASAAATRAVPTLKFVPGATLTRPAASFGLASALPRPFRLSSPETPDTRGLLVGLQQDLSSIPAGDTRSIAGSLTQFYSGSLKVGTPAAFTSWPSSSFGLKSPEGDQGQKRQEPPAPKKMSSKTLLANLLACALLAGGAAAGALVSLPWWAGPLTLIGGFVVFGAFSIADAWVNSRKLRAVADVAAYIATLGLGVSLGALGAWVYSLF